MKAEWTPSGGGLATLGDDSIKVTIELDQIGGAGAEQVNGLFRSATVLRQARGNVAGDCVFTVGKSHATYAAALTYFKAEYARMTARGSLVLTEGASTLTMANAVLKGVTRTEQVGLRWWIRYTFGITTIT